MTPEQAQAVLSAHFSDIKALLVALHQNRGRIQVTKMSDTVDAGYGKGITFEQGLMLAWTHGYIQSFEAHNPVVCMVIGEAINSLIRQGDPLIYEQDERLPFGKADEKAVAQYLIDNGLSTVTIQ